MGKSQTSRKFKSKEEALEQIRFELPLCPWRINDPQFLKTPEQTVFLTDNNTSFSAVQETPNQLNSKQEDKKCNK